MPSLHLAAAAAAAAAAAVAVAVAVAVAAADPGTLSDERISALPCLAPPSSHPRPPPRLLTLGHTTPGRSFPAVVVAAPAVVVIKNKLAVVDNYHFSLLTFMSEQLLPILVLFLRP